MQQRHTAAAHPPHAARSRATHTPPPLSRAARRALTLTHAPPPAAFSHSHTRRRTHRRRRRHAPGRSSMHAWVRAPSTGRRAAR
eukprot:184746-Prymnesium_polylepis.1